MNSRQKYIPKILPFFEQECPKNEAETERCILGPRPFFSNLAGARSARSLSSPLQKAFVGRLLFSPAASALPPLHFAPTPRKLSRLRVGCGSRFSSGNREFGHFQ